MALMQHKRVEALDLYGEDTIHLTNCNEFAFGLPDSAVEIISREMCVVDDSIM